MSARAWCPCCGDPRPPVTWGDLSVSMEAGAFWRDRRIALSPQRLSLLHHLARRAPAAVCRDALLLGSFSEEVQGNVLTVQVAHLRRILREAGLPLTVACAWGQGYRLERTREALQGSVAPPPRHRAQMAKMRGPSSR